MYICSKKTTDPGFACDSCPTPRLRNQDPRQHDSLRCDSFIKSMSDNTKTGWQSCKAIPDCDHVSWSAFAVTFHSSTRAKNTIQMDRSSCIVLNRPVSTMYAGGLPSIVVQICIVRVKQPAWRGVNSAGRGNNSGIHPKAPTGLDTTTTRNAVMFTVYPRRIEKKLRSSPNQS